MPSLVGSDSTRPGRRVVYVDRDGTINPDFHYLSDPDRVEILEGVTAGIRALRERGFVVVCTTNQSGIARGLYTAATVEAIHERIQRRLASGAAQIDRFYFCPHRPEEGCPCRKPRLGMFLAAEQELGLGRKGSAIIGDRWLDISVGQQLGLLRILVPERGRENETWAEFSSDRPRPEFVAPDFLAAVRHVLERA
ncbi:MAG: HAD family hydrolase [Thermoplasmata archaeon]|nr:HAD family hydrolase [Thermoplasmata archaeon]